MARISNNKRLKNSQMISMGLSDRRIALELGVSHRCVAHYRSRHESTKGINDSPKSGRPKVITVRMRRRMRRMIIFQECDTAVQVRSSIIMGEGQAPSLSTIKRSLGEAGLVSAIKRKKPFLSARHRRLRLAFARQHANWTVDDWKRVIFSDESKIQLFGSEGRQRCWKIPGESLSSRTVNPTVKHGGGNVMIWGLHDFTWCWIYIYVCARSTTAWTATFTGRSSLAKCSTLSSTMTLIAVVQFSSTTTTPNTLRRRRWNGWTTTTSLFCPGLRSLRILIPIEHLWSELKRRVHDSGTIIKNIDELWDWVQVEWNKIPQEFIDSLYTTMPQPIKDLIRAKGGYITC